MAMTAPSSLACVLLAVWTVCSGCTTAAALCTITGATWSYLAPGVFQGEPWRNDVTCLYAFKPRGGGDGGGFSFTSPPACRDKWRAATGAVTGRVVELTFTMPGSGDEPCSLVRGPTKCTETKLGSPTNKKLGWINQDCSLIDMDDGGLYIRGKHPIEMAPHEWLRAATAWVMRAAMITFSDGTRHLTPGTPIAPHAGPHYVGQWMRDGFYGISNAWSLVNETVQQSFIASADWMFSHAREDGILPQYCPPKGPCQYGQTCKDAPPAAGWRQCMDLDSSSFGVKFAAHLWEHGMDNATATAFWQAWEKICRYL